MRTRHTIAALTATLITICSPISTAAGALEVPSLNDNLLAAQACSGSGFSECVVETTVPSEGIIVNGKHFGPEDGLQVTTITIEVDQSQDTFAPNQVTPMWAPYYNTYIAQGTSWIRNQEILQLRYRGSTQAGGNVYNGKRIIQTTLKYRRNGVEIGSAVSNALWRNNQWQAGPIAQTATWDSLTPGDTNRTQFFYNFYSVSPNITG